MTVNFYTDNEQKAPTVANFIFTLDHALMMVGQNVSHAGKRYQVNSLAWSDDNKQVLNAFVWQYQTQ